MNEYEPVNPISPSVESWVVSRVPLLLLSAIVVVILAIAFQHGIPIVAEGRQYSNRKSARMCTPDRCPGKCCFCVAPTQKGGVDVWHFSPELIESGDHLDCR